MKPKHLVGIGLAAALLTSACAAGRQAATANEKPTLDGVNADLGSLHIRGMVIDPPANGLFYKKGEGATVKVVIVNVGTKPDVLTQISSKAVADWGAFSSAEDAAALVDPSSAPSDAPTPTQNRRITIEPGVRTSFGTPETSDVLAVLSFSHAEYPGTTVPLTLHFEQAGSVTVAVPIALSDSVNTTPIPEPTDAEG